MEHATALRSAVLATRKRVRASPMLRLEKVAVPHDVQRVVERAVATHKRSVRDLRAVSKRSELSRAPEAQVKMLKRTKAPANSPVLPPPDYRDSDHAVSHAAIRSPGTRAAAVHVLTELRRLIPNLKPRSILDFGAGAAVATAAAAHVFSPTPTKPTRKRTEQTEIPEADDDVEDSENVHEASIEKETETEAPVETFLQSAVLVEPADAMRGLGDAMLEAEPAMNGVSTRWMNSVPYMRSGAGVDDGYDLVLCTYTLADLARAAMSSQGESRTKRARVRYAESVVRKHVESLWDATSPGGYVVIIEDGTAAGFETILLARALLTAGGDGGKVVAPCLHSGTCALQGSVTRHRVCRFVQRLNRPLFLRIAKPLPNGFEDEHFSYVIVQKPGGVDEAVSDEHPGDKSELNPEGWGRLVRNPLLRGKHVVLDACLRDGSLVRHVISKKNSAPGMYHVARKAKWGDVWPFKPNSSSQPVHF